MRTDLPAALQVPIGRGWLGCNFALTGFSLQTSNPKFVQVHGRTFDYIKRSAEAGKPWAVAFDELGDASQSLSPDKDNPKHDNARKIALDFFNQQQLPVGDMWCMDELIDGEGDYVFADPGVVYLVFLKSGKNVLDLSRNKASYKLKWLNTRTGEYVEGGTVKGGGKVTLTPPDNKDWLGLHEEVSPATAAFVAEALGRLD